LEDTDEIGGKDMIHIEGEEQTSSKLVAGKNESEDEKNED
jgi:hypothetical protein